MNSTLPEAVTAPDSSPVPQGFPAPLYRVLLVALFALTAGSGATLWLERSRYETFPAYLQARLRTVTAPREGKVARLLVAPGTAVAAGQPLAVLEDESFARRLRDKQHDVTALEIELSRTRAALEVELDIQQRDIRDRIFETQCRSTQLLRQQLLVPSASRLSEQISGSDGDGLPPLVTGERRPPLIFGDNASIRRISTDDAPPAPREGLLKIAMAEMELCKNHIRELEEMSRELPDKISRSMGVDLVEARLAHAQAELDALEEEQQELTLVAETAGIVGVFHKVVGDRVVAHEPIVQVLDEEQPYLVLQFPSRRISDFSPGTVVDVRFPGGRKGRGRVEEIPPQTTAMPADGSPAQETAIAAHVERVGALWPSLPFGSVVEVQRRR
ncbi:MAG: HlyD family secretion protein [Planctomycetaceae bacterium]